MTISEDLHGSLDLVIHYWKVKVKTFFVGVLKLLIVHYLGKLIEQDFCKLFFCKVL